MQHRRMEQAGQDAENRWIGSAATKDGATVAKQRVPLGAP